MGFLFVILWLVTVYIHWSTSFIMSFYLQYFLRFVRNGNPSERLTSLRDRGISVCSLIRFCSVVFISLCSRHLQIGRGEIFCLYPLAYFHVISRIRQRDTARNFFRRQTYRYVASHNYARVMENDPWDTFAS